MIVLDTSLLIDALSGSRRSAAALRRAIERGERLLLPSLVLYEWLRGPRLEEELTAQQALLPSEEALPFGEAEAAAAARLYGRVARPRGRELDLAIAAHAVVRQARIWTLNPADFEDLPDVAVIGAHAEPAGGTGEVEAGDRVEAEVDDGGQAEAGDHGEAEAGA